MVAIETRGLRADNEFGGFLLPSAFTGVSLVEMVPN